MKRIRVGLLAVILLVAANAASAEHLVGRVVGVTDGDTLTLLVDNRQQYKVRLAGIDSPEKRQPYGQRARELLSDLTFDRVVRVEWNNTDRYGRVIGKVLVSGKDANLEMLTSGMAWHYKKYAGTTARRQDAL